LRALPRRSEPQMALVNLSAAIRDVVNLVSSDAVIRNITVTLDIGTLLVIVLGDRVQLQQLMLNLIITPAR
jgi:signal transduction histidine kinase